MDTNTRRFARRFTQYFTRRFAFIPVGFAALLLVLGVARDCPAHVITHGYTLDGPGAVTIWYGSYHAPSDNPNGLPEGSLQLAGINGNPFPATIVPFSLYVTTLPAGLIPNVNYFVDPAWVDPNNTHGTSINDARIWQGVSFTGLAPGNYLAHYIPLEHPSADLHPFSGSVLDFTFTLTDPRRPPPSVPTPEPASLLAWCLILGGGLGYRVSKRALPTH